MPCRAPGESVTKLRNGPITLHKLGIVRGLLDAAGYAAVSVVSPEHYRDAINFTGDPIPGLPDRASSALGDCTTTYRLLTPPCASCRPRHVKLPGCSGVIKDLCSSQQCVAGRAPYLSAVRPSSSPSPCTSQGAGCYGSSALGDSCIVTIWSAGA
jgi:hypothetical protein